MRSDTSLCTVLKSGAGERGSDKIINQHFLEKERFHNNTIVRSDKEEFTYSQYWEEPFPVT